MIFIVIGLLVLVVEEVAMVLRVVGGFAVVVDEVARVFRVVGCSLVQIVVMPSSHQIMVRSL